MDIITLAACMGMTSNTIDQKIATALNETDQKIATALKAEKIDQFISKNSDITMVELTGIKLGSVVIISALFDTTASVAQFSTVFTLASPLDKHLYSNAILYDRTGDSLAGILYANKNDNIQNIKALTSGHRYAFTLIMGLQ